MEPRRSKHFLAHIPTIALLVVFAMSPWLGILFFILRAIDRDAEKKEQENAEYSSDFRPQDTGAGQPARDTEPVYGHDVPTAEQQNAKKWHKTLTSLCTVFGGIFLVVGLAGLADIIDLWGYWFDWGEFLTALAQTIGGGAALAMGLRMKQARKLERQLDKIVGTRDNIPLDELFAAAGIDADRGRAAVERFAASIDCTAVENEVANSMYQRSELDWLIYNDPLAYAELILNGGPELYLKAVTKKTPLD